MEALWVDTAELDWTRAWEQGCAFISFSTTFSQINSIECVSETVALVYKTQKCQVKQFPVHLLLALRMVLNLLILSHELISACVSLWCYTLAYYCFGLLPFLLSYIYSQPASILQELLTALQTRNSKKFCLSCPTALIELHSSVSENKSSNLNPVIISVIGNGPCSFNSATSKCPIMSELIGCSG